MYLIVEEQTLMGVEDEMVNLNRTDKKVALNPIHEHHTNADTVDSSNSVRIRR